MPMKVPKRERLPFLLHNSKKPLHSYPFPLRVCNPHVLTFVTPVSRFMFIAVVGAIPPPAGSEPATAASKASLNNSLPSNLSIVSLNHAVSGASTSTGGGGGSNGTSTTPRRSRVSSRESNARGVSSSGSGGGNGGNGGGYAGSGTSGGGTIATGGPSGGAAGSGRPSPISSSYLLDEVGEGEEARAGSRSSGGEEQEGEGDDERGLDSTGGGVIGGLRGGGTEEQEGGGAGWTFGGMDGGMPPGSPPRSPLGISPRASGKRAGRTRDLQRDAVGDTCVDIFEVTLLFCERKHTIRFNWCHASEEKSSDGGTALTFAQGRVVAPIWGVSRCAS